MDMTLHEISADLKDALLAEEFDEERIDELSHAFETKAQGIIAVSNQMTAFTDMCKAEEKRIADKRKAIENRMARLKAYLQNNMEAAEIMEMDLGTVSLKLQKNQPKVIIDDEVSLPAKFTKIIQTRQIDKNAVKDAIKSGEKVDGAHLEQGLSLRIK